jgi:hypothetical protein
VNCSEFLAKEIAVPIANLLNAGSGAAFVQLIPGAAMPCGRISTLKEALAAPRMDVSVELASSASTLTKTRRSTRSQVSHIPHRESRTRSSADLYFRIGHDLHKWSMEAFLQKILPELVHKAIHKRIFSVNKILEKIRISPVLPAILSCSPIIHSAISVNKLFIRKRWRNAESC